MFLRSKALKKDLELPQGSTIIGRLAESDIVLNPDYVSKHHLEIRVSGSQVRVRDMGSRNGTRVNTREIRRAGWVVLQPGDCIEIRKYDFQLMQDRGPSEDSGACIVEEEQSSASLSSSHSISLSEMPGGPQVHSQLRALLEVTRALSDVLHIEDVLERSVDILLRIFPVVDRAVIGYIHDASRFEPKWWRLRNRDPEGVIRISSTIVQQVVETSLVMMTNCAPADFPQSGSVCELPMRSVMVAPLISTEEKVFGLIHVDANQPDRFSPLDLEVLAAVATQLALAVNFARMHVTAIGDALLRKDVEQARAVQQQYLPTAPPQIVGYELAGFYRAARHVGGDYYDYIPLADGRMAIVLGDVAGKGVPAALTMVGLARETRASLEIHQTPSEVLGRLNRKLCDNFITFVCLILDPVTNRVTISNAGHELPLLRTADGEVCSCGAESAGCPLSAQDDEQYQEATIQLAPGDLIVLFSDGFPDSEQKCSLRFFGRGPISECLRAYEGAATGFINSMVDQVDRFVDGEAQFDDMCMVCLRRNR